MQPVTVLVLVGSLVVGAALGLIATLKLAAARRGEASRLLNAFNFVLIGLLVAAAFPLDYFGVQRGLIGGSVLLGLGLFALALAKPSGATAPLVIVAGLGAAVLYLGLLPLMPRGLLGEHEVAASLLFGFVFLGLGGLLLPPLLDTLLAAVGYRLAMVLLGVGAFAPAVLAAVTPVDSFPAQPPFDPLAAASASRVWLAGLVFAFYAPLEAFVSVWVTTFLTDQARLAAAFHAPPADAITDGPGPPLVNPVRVGSDQAAGWLGWFWLAFLGSRALVGVLQHVSTIGDAWQPFFLVAPALLAAVVLGNLSGSTHTHKALSGLIVLGLVLGPVLPMLLAALAGVQRATGGTALAAALLHACGAAGGVVLSPLVSVSAEGRTAQAALRIPLFMALLTTAAAILFALTGER